VENFPPKHHPTPNLGFIAAAEVNMTVQPLLDTFDRSASASTPSQGVDAPISTRSAQAAAVVEASRSLQMRTQFLRRVAHDIASPTGVTMTVLEELASESSRPDLVAMARRGLRRLLRLSEQLAVAADLEAGSLSPDTTLEDVRTLVKDALDQAVGIDGRRDIVASCDVPNERLSVEVDRRLVASILREVIGNALRLASSRVAVDLSLADDGAKIAVRVQDDGPGFSNEALANLGQRFTPGSTTRGLGLSLSIAKDILASHGGELHVEASTLPPGRRGSRGSAVVVTLPIVVTR
jgi:two-component system sensor histidine kinase TctE